MSANQLLQEAYRLIREGNKAEATAMLVPLVRDDPNNADAWWLLANAIANADQQRRALDQVLRIRPNDNKARQMLAKMNGESFTPPAPTPPAPPYGGDPFAPTSVSQRPQPPASEDPFYQPPTQNDPFGYAAPRSAPSGVRIYGDDPFTEAPGGSPTIPAPSFGSTNARRDARTDATVNTPFNNDPFTSAPVGGFGVAPKRRRSGCSTCLIIVGVLSLFGCVACVGSVLLLPRAVSGAVYQALDQIETQSPGSSAGLRQSFDSLLAGRFDEAAEGFQNSVVDIAASPFALTFTANPEAGNAFRTLVAGGEVPPEIRETLVALNLNFNFGTPGTPGFNFSSGSGSGAENQGLPGNVNRRGTIEVGGSEQGTIAAGTDGDVWTLRLREGETVIIESTDDDTDTTIAIYDSAEARVAYDDDGGDEFYNALLEFTAPTAGDYTLVVDTFSGNDGPYRLTVERAP